MGKRLLVAAGVLTTMSGCTDTCEDRAQWNIDITRAAGPDVIPSAQAARAPNGTIYVALRDRSSTLTFGDETIVDAQIARVDGGGRLVGLTRAPDGDSLGIVADLGISDRGTDIVVKWAEPDSVVTSYDESLAVRWTHRLPDTTYSSLFEVGPAGETVAITQLSPPIVYYVTPDGQLSWQVPLPSGMVISDTRVADNGDVFAFAVGRRYRLSAATGALLETLSTNGLPFLGARDGSYVAFDFSTEGRLSSVTSYKVDGSMRWSTPVDGLELVDNPRFATTGDIVALVATGETHAELMFFDAQTGAVKRRVTSCADLNVISVDADHYFGIGYGRSASTGLARFANR